jgi:hypothetical protein
VHQESAVGDVNQLDAVYGAHGRDDLLAVLAGRGVDADVADDRIAADADNVYRAPRAPVRLASRTRKVRLLLALGVFGIAGAS